MSAFRKFYSASQIKLVRRAKADFRSRKALSRALQAPKAARLKFWASLSVPPPTPARRSRHE
jgi:hypothetical protein